MSPAPPFDPQRAAKRRQNQRSDTSATTDPSIAARAAIVPIRNRNEYLRATEGKVPPRTAIKLFCLECVEWDHDEVRRCPSVACPLWAYRPFQND